MKFSSDLGLKKISCENEIKLVKYLETHHELTVRVVCVFVVILNSYKCFFIHASLNRTDK